MKLAAALLLAALIAPAAAGDTETADRSHWTAAAWCAVVGDAEDSAGDFEAVGCDAGVGFGVVSWTIQEGRRLSVVAAIGEHSVAAGLALATISTERVEAAVAVGVAAPYDSRGIFTDGAALTVGATIGWGRN